MNSLGTSNIDIARPLSEKPDLGHVEKDPGLAILHSKNGHLPVALNQMAEAVITLHSGIEDASNSVKQKDLAPSGDVKDSQKSGRARSRNRPDSQFILSARHRTVVEDFGKSSTNDPQSVTRSRPRDLFNKPKSDNARALAVIRQEIQSINLAASAKNLTGTFLRSDSQGQKMIKNLIFPEFEAPAKQMMADVYTKLETSLSSLGPNASMSAIDDALTDAYQTMIQGLCSIPLPDSFKEVVGSIASALESNAKDAMAKATPDKQREIREVVNELKKGIPKALMLRVFTPHVNEFTKPENPAFKSTVTKINGWIDSHPSARISGMQMSKFAAFMLTKINGASGSKQVALGEHFPKLLQTFKQSDLSGFTAMVELEATLASN